MCKNYPGNATAQKITTHDERIFRNFRRKDFLGGLIYAFFREVVGIEVVVVPRAAAGASCIKVRDE